MACLLALAATRAWGVQATLVADAHVSSAQPKVNSGTLSNLNVGGGYTSLVQFDLGVLPNGTTAAQITRAMLRVYCNRADTPGVVSVANLGGAWSEYGVTYTTLPAIGTAMASANASAGVFVTFDVTTAVQGWVSGASANNGLAFTSASAVVQFDSKENDQTAHAPQLEIALAAGGSAVGVAGPTGATGATGLTGATGATGPQGMQGVQGPQGVIGPIGMTGAIGATGATGATGVAGAIGVTGATGAQGLAGVDGGQGATGATGATGSTGSPGLVYQGTYSSVTNYALGDVVSFGGASFVSLGMANHGQTPGASPEWWAVVAAQGATGAAGPIGATGMAGPQGLLGPVGPPGEKGDQGAQGIAGQAGAQGISGVTGATGLQGPMGPQGIAGPTGLSFRGAYDSSVNYALGDGVLWQGAGWVSMVANNHGNTPDQSPTAWTMFAQAGSAGLAGATGATGATGVAGLNGAQGATGAPGSIGATGATGAAGLVYQGTYSSVMNYALGDVVVFGGSSYASLIASNHGNMPDASPEQWGLLAAVGAVGARGVAGPSGATGATGVGLVGPAGGQGPAGVQGPMGVQGPAGAQGLVGATGAKGDVGATGAQGVAGQAGSQGVQGVTGATGMQGPPGVTGPQGAVGLTMQGAYDSSANYAVGDGVLWQGAGYVSLVGNNHGNVPDESPAMWQMFSARGLQGVAGPTGTQGIAGTIGPQGVVGATGAQGMAGVQGLAGPQGVAGATGATGATGAVGMNFRNVWSSATNYNVNDAVTFNGATYLALAASTNQQPDGSPQNWIVIAQAGGAGPTGAAATVSLGMVTKLAAGSTPTVTITGTPQAAILNFGIPQGATGATGATGSGGTTATVSSGNFAAMAHAVSFSTTYYSVNTALAAPSENMIGIMTWVPRGCTATRLDVQSQQSGNITVTLRVGDSLANMADTTLACTIPVTATTSACPATGSVSIPAGDFIDYKIAGASGSSAAVWTALECD